MEKYSTGSISLTRGKIHKETFRDTENFVRTAAKRVTLGRGDERSRKKNKIFMKYRKFLLHYVYKYGILFTVISREEITDMKIFTQALPDDLVDMIFLDEPWTHCER